MMTEEDNHLYEEGMFFGVYILNCKGPERKGDVYIGFTVNPQRRIRQHNREIRGGAWKTKKNKGNWDMVLIVHGFKSKVSALQFEWAWQNPQRSKRLSHLKKKTTKETKFTYKLRILSEMLNTGPWSRLPLTIHWLKQEYREDFPIDSPPPMHIPIAYGQLKKAKKVVTDSHEEKEEDIVSQTICLFCNNEKLNFRKDESFLHCIVKSCDFVGHITCYSEHFLKSEKKGCKPFLIPISGVCPGCDQYLLWGDLVRQRRYSLVENEDGGSDDDDTATTSQDNVNDGYDDDEDVFQS